MKYFALREWDTGRNHPGLAHLCVASIPPRAGHRAGQSVGRKALRLAGAWAALVALFLFASPVYGQTPVTVDWGQQMLAGGWTMVFLGLLSVALVAFIVERFWTLRRKRFCPPGLMQEVMPCLMAGQWSRVDEAIDRHPSTLAEIIRFTVQHRASPFDNVAAMVTDIGTRDVIDQEERTSPLAVIAGVAPLLGLLGTMIGMIEAFQLVSIYGDEGGASMLAGAIAKALITTATGLVLAIPALVGFHYFKRRLHNVAINLDAETQRLMTACFFEAVPTSAKAKEPGSPKALKENVQPQPRLASKPARPEPSKKPTSPADPKARAADPETGPRS